MMQGLPPRGGVWKKHGSNVRVDEQKPDIRRQRRTSRLLTAKSISINGAKRRSGDCARKATELTPGDLLRRHLSIKLCLRASELHFKSILKDRIELMQRFLHTSGDLGP